MDLINGESSVGTTNMKRIKKFRVWDPILKEMFNNVELKGAVWNKIICDGGAGMEWTGQKDRCLIDIYEGDILKDCSASIKKEDGTIFPVLKEVFWVSGNCGFSPFLHLEESIGDVVMVVGNIYENPTMMEDYRKRLAF